MFFCRPPQVTCPPGSTVIQSLNIFQYGQFRASNLPNTGSFRQCEESIVEREGMGWGEGGFYRVPTKRFISHQWGWSLWSFSCRAEVTNYICRRVSTSLWAYTSVWLCVVKTMDKAHINSPLELETFELKSLCPQADILIGIFILTLDFPARKTQTEADLWKQSTFLTLTVLQSGWMAEWKSFQRSGSTALLFNYHLLVRGEWASCDHMTKCRYRWAAVVDAVVRQWIHCPDKLSWEGPLWSADINLHRQTSGGVSSHPLFLSLPSCFPPTLSFSLPVSLSLSLSLPYKHTHTHIKCINNFN